MRIFINSKIKWVGTNPLFKNIILITFVFLLPGTSGIAQPLFKTVVPQRPLIVGESFQVQYIVSDESKLSNFTVPEFRNFRMVTGPHIYVGTLGSVDQTEQVQNTVYTLMPLYPGRFLIPGATVVINNKTYQSNDELVQVISKEEAIKRSRKEAESNMSEYFLRPGEDPYEKIRNNLFVKVMVDKHNCYVGQPVVATFKLYSRLESSSDIVKNPGFYGFTVFDMINLNDRQISSEIINGKTFDVHTIRKMQLYPLREGNFSVDAMEVKNTVEFSRSVVNKKTEQQIAEGVLKENTYTPEEGSEVFETTIRTTPIAIKVKGAPLKNRPDSFNGATGHFAVNARILKDHLARNEEGILEIIVSGQGNFTQLAAPGIKWPSGIEGFEPTITEKLDRFSVPLAGNKIFHYGFLSSRQGEYEIPSIQFAYLNPDSGGYKIVSTPDLKVIVTAEEKIIQPAPSQTTVKGRNKKYTYWLAAAALLVASAALIFMFIRRRSNKQITTSAPIHATVFYPGEKELLAPVYLLVREKDKIFYTALREAIWQFFGQQFKWSGSQFTKDGLLKRLSDRAIDQDMILEIGAILQQCEEGMFTNADLAGDKTGLVRKTEQVLKKIGEKLL